MSGQGTVAIGENIWAVDFAVTAAELTSGLSGVESIPAGSGILFDMGYDHDSLRINMADMLFSLDIVFVNSEHGVVGVLHDVAPGEDALFDAGNGLGARYFMEVNAGEAVNVSVGDAVDIAGEIQPSFWAAMITAVQAVAVIGVVGAAAYKEIKGTLKGEEHQTGR